jgi:hypothetical protein
VTDIEQRLRQELQEVTERVVPGSVRPLRERPPRHRARVVRWLAPAAAVVAVIAVVTGVSVVSRSQGQRPAPTANAAMPPYYVIVQNGYVGLASTVTVRESATGRVLATLRVPFRLPGGVGWISGAADDRTFVMNNGNDLFRLRLAADGRSVRISRLPITLSNSVNYAALSPDGSTIAIESQTCAGTKDQCQSSTIRLVSLATGRARTWKTRTPAETDMWISWDGNAHVLFSWAPANAAPSRPTGYRLLDVTGRGGNLLSAKTLRLPPLPVLDGFTIAESAFITPGGRAVIGSTLAEVGSGKMPPVVMKVVEWSERSGRLLRVLLKGRERQALVPPSEMCWVFSLGATGVHALIECPYPKFVFGRWDDGRFTPLPGMSAFPGVEPAAW